MRFLLFILFTMISLGALEINFTSFQGDFKQTITDEKGKSLIYSGKVKLKDNQRALWAYKKPIVKEVYFIEETVSIVESDLEQVIIKTLRDELDLAHIVKNANKIDNTHYEAESYSKKYLLTVKDKKIVKIEYKDEFENSSMIEFSHIILNEKIDDKVFSFIIPEEFDVIR